MPRERVVDIHAHIARAFEVVKFARGIAQCDVEIVDADQLARDGLAARGSDAHFHRYSPRKKKSLLEVDWILELAADSRQVSRRGVAARASAIEVVAARFGISCQHV